MPVAFVKSASLMRKLLTPTIGLMQRMHSISHRIWCARAGAGFLPGIQVKLSRSCSPNSENPWA